MGDQLKPWEILPALKLEYLFTIRQIVWRVQKAVAQHWKATYGDDLWIAGCRGYKWRKKAISKLAQKKARAWLSVGILDHQFVFKINGVPIRVFRTPSDGKVPKRYKDPTQLELALLNAAFEAEESSSLDRFFRLEIHTDKQANPLSIELVQVDTEGNRFNPFVIPAQMEVPTVEVPTKLVVDDPIAAAANESVRPVQQRRKPIVLPEPEIISRKNQTTKKQPETGAEGTHG